MSYLPPEAFDLAPENLVAAAELISHQDYDRLQEVWHAAANASAIDRILTKTRTGMKWDPTAAELFKTIRTTLDRRLSGVVGTRFSSIHDLIAGEGTLHFHPETHGDSGASERILIMYPYGEGQDDVVEFEWAGLENAKPIGENGRNYVEGDIQDPHYSIKLKPGQITLIRLFSGAHGFRKLTKRGGAFVRSLHPLDIVEADDVETGITRTGDSMMDNTWEYRGKSPDSAELIMPQKAKFIIPDKPVKLTSVMASHLKTAKKFIVAGPDRKATHEDLVQELRKPYLEMAA